MGRQAWWYPGKQRRGCSPKGWLQSHELLVRLLLLCCDKSAASCVGVQQHRRPGSSARGAGRPLAGVAGSGSTPGRGGPPFLHSSVMNCVLTLNPSNYSLAAAGTPVRLRVLQRVNSPQEVPGPVGWAGVAGGLPPSRRPATPAGSFPHRLPLGTLADDVLVYGLQYALRMQSGTAVRADPVRWHPARRRSHTLTAAKAAAAVAAAVTAGVSRHARGGPAMHRRPMRARARTSLTTSSITAATRAYFSKMVDSVGGLPHVWWMACMITRRMPDTAANGRCSVRLVRWRLWRLRGLCSTSRTVRLPAAGRGGRGATGARGAVGGGGGTHRPSHRTRQSPWHRTPGR